MNDLSGSGIGHIPPDEQECNLILLSGLWRLVWEYRQFSSMAEGSPGGGTLMAATRFQELSRCLQNFRLSCDDRGISDANSIRTGLMLELISMHLNMSLEHVQLYAGLEGEGSARNVWPLLMEWIGTTASRQAMLHAGQIIRIAKSFGRGHLRDIYSVAVFHAAIAIWAFGVIPNTNGSISGSSPDRNTMVSQPQDPIVWLDGAECKEVKRFIALNRGFPALRDRQAEDEAIFLSNPAATLDISIDILKRNHQDAALAEGDSAPPLVKNLVQLMSSLRDRTEAMKGQLHPPIHTLISV
jgi:hypothetical protein